MEENPFVVSGHIRPEYFCDRRAESERMVKLLTNGNNVVLKSDRRMGKTGLIQYCFDQPVLRDNYYTFFVDILHTTCLQELVHGLGRAVYEQTVPRGKRMVQNFVKSLRSIGGKMGFDANTGLPTFTLGLGDIEQPEYTMEEIFGYLQHADRPCIVAIDEFQQVAKYPEKNIEALLRGHIQRIDNCRFVFAGSERHMLEQMFDSRNHPFYKSADNMNLGPIDRDVYVEFMLQKFREKGRELDPEAAEEAYDLFEGHTYYVQKVMNESFANTPAGSTCTKGTLDAAIGDILAGNDYYYRDLLSRMTMRQKMLLYAIARDGVATQITSADFVKRHKLASASSVQSAIKKLLSDDFVVEESRRYRVNDRFFGLWIGRRMVG
ncbi:MAG: ATP-binding protein [Bacteroidales bacterium]|nr:ATP-binding protein [Bacteroidales bacterium]